MNKWCRKNRREIIEGVEWLPKDLMCAERPWRIAASLAASGAACPSVLKVWVPAALGLWELATFTPGGPIRPMGLVGHLVGGLFVGIFMGMPLSLLAFQLSRRPAAQAVAAVGVVVAGVAQPGLHRLLDHRIRPGH